ncbi:glycosyltransferase family 2 protein [Desertifilum sp. FACHB-1129]|uniref:Glycosyl transferase n=2 Tax=Desertifilum tharense IPPAS B-1220 TaxID=1781255 RepID=A0A1E5QG14_9CYAN|nr:MULTISPECIES: hormogonium polysaccharide biosynthesis glycosyltransferase HpsE [Desertifilum]MDA0211585.1 hormogonium polysaccharide biosynthesis glycosyltransferase HpsE [Cyanobacteria bacterium FC1]MBD2310109.1 glycosyltransferase family 2 protein [Desertifilum sp. FACHB-1129]MBD2322087.1 glycosyltransferase family 2 protein [Desertifilum sp. FACHB-866]MBD2333834.1 glycosyltransferase family 2 protein [Desertifilum sp. FACHB-868]OEJ73514.1 glycosyl transferase [Desertifilum tharense IPPAS
MPVDFTVAICTYNGASRLPEVLERLRQQVYPPSLRWEVLVIDNNSTDNTAEIVKTFQTRFPPTVPLIYAVECKQGLAYGRQKAMELANGKYVGFLDDDNLATPQWVAEAFGFGEANPKVGAYGSRIFGEFEVTPPPNFDKLAPFLALTDRGGEARIYEPHHKILPPGAGLVIRRQAWLDHVPTEIQLSGRVGNSMVCGEDLEAVLYIQQAGWEVWYNPKMCIYHQIPHWRLEREYLLRLFRGIGLSRYRTRMLSVKTWQRPAATVAYMINDLRKVVSHLVKHKTAIRDNLVAACELELYVASLQSPFYLKALQKSKQAEKSSSLDMGLHHS